MARTLVAAATTLPTGSYPTLQPGAGTLTLAFQAADVANKNYTPLVAGKTMLFAMNTGAAPYTITVTSVADTFKRTGDITAYSLAAITGTTPIVVPLGPFASAGWLSPTGGGTPTGLWFEASNAAVLFAVLTLA